MRSFLSLCFLVPPQTEVRVVKVEDEEVRSEVVTIVDTLLSSVVVPPPPRSGVQQPIPEYRGRKASVNDVIVYAQPYAA